MRPANKVSSRRHDEKAVAPPKSCALLFCFCPQTNAKIHEPSNCGHHVWFDHDAIREKETTTHKTEKKKNTGQSLGYPIGGIQFHQNRFLSLRGHMNANIQVEKKSLFL
jgi:hypothetical protein